MSGDGETMIKTMILIMIVIDAIGSSSILLEQVATKVNAQ